MDVVLVLTKVVQEQQQTIAGLKERVSRLEESRVKLNFKRRGATEPVAGPQFGSVITRAGEFFSVSLPVE